ncbi:MAG: zinc-dependent metalloprotease [bacterium]|nr:zinc-dependent metalloprotease [bacterium]
MTHAVDWDLAQKVAFRVAERGGGPDVRSPQVRSIGRDFAEATEQAERLVAEATGLQAASEARARVVDRRSWIRANVASFQRLLRPLTDRMDSRIDRSGPMHEIARTASGAEVGALLGWMSRRVLGQYDLLIIEDDKPDDQDMVYYVGPNVVSLERRHGFPVGEFRLWLALHECTHRAQFMGIPWLRGHFLGLVDEALDVVDPDPVRMLDAARRLMEARRGGDDPFRWGGLTALLAPPSQQGALERLSGMMSLLEGHGDVTMDRAGADRLSESARFGRVLRSRRTSARGLAKLLQRLVGIEAKLYQYQAGEAFIAAVERIEGVEFVERAWARPECLPDMAEIQSPELWIERMNASAAA